MTPRTAAAPLCRHCYRGALPPQVPVSSLPAVLGSPQPPSSIYARASSSQSSAEVRPIRRLGKDACLQVSQRELSGSTQAEFKL